VRKDDPELHPGAEEAIELGVKQERLRCILHVRLGDASGDIHLTYDCIEQGLPIDRDVVERHTRAALKKRRSAIRLALIDRVAGDALGHRFIDPFAEQHRSVTSERGENEKPSKT